MQPATSAPDKPPAPEGYLENFINVRQSSVATAAERALQRLSNASDGDVRAIAASQIELLSRFYDLALSQAGRSFRWALVASMIGLVFFLMAILFWFWRSSGELVTITMLGGALIEFIAGVNFYLYGKTLSQLSLFQGRLEVTQRFLLANSLCESLGEAWRDPTRARLINQLTMGHPLAEYSEISPDPAPMSRNNNNPPERMPDELSSSAMAQPAA